MDTEGGLMIKDYTTYLRIWRGAATILCMVLLILPPGKAIGQRWETALGGSGVNDNSMGNAIVELADGDFLVVGGSDFGHPDSIYVARISWDGSLLWSKNYAQGIAFNIKETAPGIYTIVGAIHTTQQAFIGSIDGNGNVLAYHSVGTNVKGFDFAIAPGGSVFICGTDEFSNHSVVIKLNNQGSLIWQYEYDFSNARLTSITFDDETLYTSGVANDSVVLLRIDTLGTLVWRRSYFKDPSWGNELHYDHDGSFLIAGSDASNPYFSTARILKLDSAGNLITSFNFGATIGLHYEPFGLALTQDMGYVLSGSIRSGCCSRYRFLMKLDAQGNQQWERIYFDPFPMQLNNGCRTIQTSDGGYATAGRVFGGSGNNYKLSAYKVDATGHYPTNIIGGTAYVDYNGDCIMNGDDVPVANAMVVVDDGDQYAFTDASGYYSVRVDSGSHSVEVISPHTNLEASCPVSATHTVSMNGFHLANTSKSFALQPAVGCPVPKIDFGTPELSPCSQATYFFEYRNIGTDTSTGSFVALELDTFLSVNSSSIPYSIDDETMILPIGDLGPMESGEFVVVVDVDCNAPPSSTAYVIARMHSDSSCFLNPAWDRSDIEIESRCVGDSIEFVFYNRAAPGIGDMDTVRHYRVYEDNIVHIINPFQLLGGDSLTVRFAVNGLTYTAQAEQHAFHPYQRFAQKHVERCGGVMYTPGVMQQFGQPDVHPSIEIDLQPIQTLPTNAMKAVQPEGFLSNHIVSDEAQLEYTIFFDKPNSMLTYEISDTLSAFLDPLTFEIGASSHNFDFELRSNGVVRWKLSDYYSVGGTLIEGSERGFVKFKISQVDSNATGTIIAGRASINTNFSPEIKTNEVYNTIYNASCNDFSVFGIAQETDSMYAQVEEDSLVLFCDLKYGAECLSVLTLEPPQNGALHVINPECIVYEPDEQFSGQDTFAICLCADIWCDTIRTFCNVTASNVSPPNYHGVIPIVGNNYLFIREEQTVNERAMKQALSGDTATRYAGEWKVYPTVLTAGDPLSIHGPKTAEVIAFSLVDIFGKIIVRKRHVKSMPIFIDTKNLPSGTYYYRIVTADSGTISGSIFIQ